MELIIFDCDGTLVDSELLGSTAMEAELDLLGVQESARSLTERYRGARLADILNDLSQIHALSLPDDFVSRYRTRMHHLFSTHLRPAPGIEDLLMKLEIPFCVASSGPLEKIRHSLTVTGLLPYFGPRIFSSYEIQSWKPEPDLFLHVARALGVSPEACLVVEDSAVGTEAAKRARMTPVLYDPRSLCLASYEYPVISHMAQLLDILDHNPAL